MTASLVMGASRKFSKAGRGCGVEWSGKRNEFGAFLPLQDFWSSTGGTMTARQSPRSCPPPWEKLYALSVFLSGRRRSLRQWNQSASLMKNSWSFTVVATKNVQRNGIHMHVEIVWVSHVREKQRTSTQSLRDGWVSDLRDTRLHPHAA